MTAPPSAYALFVTGVQQGSVTIEDMSFAAPDATGPGTSSIAAFIASSSVRLERVALSAGNGANGAPGADGAQSPNYTGAAPTGGSQVSAGPPGSGTINVTGGAGAINHCTLFGMSAGGDGGLGCGSDGGTSGLGSPGTATPPAPVTMAGRDGLPRGAILPDAGGAATLSDDPGADGVAGDGGVAAAAQDYGTLSAGGWVPSPGGRRKPRRSGAGRSGSDRSSLWPVRDVEPEHRRRRGRSGRMRRRRRQRRRWRRREHRARQRRQQRHADGMLSEHGRRGHRRCRGCRSGRASRSPGRRHQLSLRARGGGVRRQRRRWIGRRGRHGRNLRGRPRVGLDDRDGRRDDSEYAARSSRSRRSRGPGGRHGSAGALTTGVDGNSGAPGSAGTSVALLKLM